MSKSKSNKPELNQNEFIASLINEKIAQLNKLNDQVTNLENTINLLKLENKPTNKISDEEYNVLLHIRRNIINKSLNKYSKEKYTEMKKMISFFDNNYNITDDRLSNIDIKF
jgi:hypothetical protein